MRTVSTTTSVPLGHGLAVSIPRELGGQGPYAEDWLVVRVRPPLDR
jgi:hypothetical protein